MNENNIIAEYVKQHRPELLETIHFKAFKMTMVERLAEYEDAEENGLLLRLPFEVGAEIYVLTKTFNVMRNKCFYAIGKFKVDRYIYNSLKNFVIVCFNKYGSDVVERHFFKTEIGKTIFKTYSEAEAALQKLQEENA